MTIEKCPPNEAEWWAQVIVSRICYPYEYLLLNKQDSEQFPLKPGDSEFERRFGTETDYHDEYFKGGRPEDEELAALVPDGWYEVEREIKRCPNDYDETTCRYCGQEIQFDRAAHPHWGSRQSGPYCRDVSSESGEHEPVNEYHE
jgi:hypothetical protein